MMLAMVQKAGRNLKRDILAGAALDFISDEREALALGAALEEAGTAGVDSGAGGSWIVELLLRGSLARIGSSALPEISFFILLDSFWSEAGVVIQAPQCGCDGYISQILNW
jgi:hypothetical protein